MRAATPVVPVLMVALSGWLGSPVRAAGSTGQPVSQPTHALPPVGAETTTAEADQDSAPPKTASSLAPARAVELLRDPATPSPVRQDAVRALAFNPSPGGDAELARVLVEDPDVSVRFLAARALEKRLTGAAALAQGLEQDPDARVRQACARALGKLGAEGTRHETALIAGVSDPSPHVVQESLRALRRVGSRASLSSVTPLTLKAEQKGVQSQARGAAKAIQRRAKERDQHKQEMDYRRGLQSNRWKATPLLNRALSYGGSVYAVGMGAWMGGTAGGLLPLAWFGNRGVWLWPLGAGLGLAAGGLSGLSYAALRKFDLPLTDAMQITVHGASGFMTGMGFGLWLGKRSNPAFNANLALLGGATALAASAGTSPWIRSRPSSVVASASGGALGGLATLLTAGAMGVDPTKQTELALGLSLMGQGVGTALGTGMGGTLPVTATDALLVDVGAVSGVAASTAVVALATVASPANISQRVVFGSLLGGMILGAGAGALSAALLPTTLENRLSAGFSMDGLPIKLVPILPVPAVQGESGKVTGALVPLLSGVLF